MAAGTTDGVTALVIGDPHFRVKEADVSWLMINNIVKISKSKQPDFIVILGDTLDTHERIHVDPLTRATTMIDQLRKVAPVYLLIGNHDLRNNQVFLEQEHPFVALKQWEDVTVIDQPKEWTIRGLSFLGVPYVPPGRFEEGLKVSGLLADIEQRTCLFAHQEFRGGRLSQTIKSQEGDLYPKEWPLCVSGHLHEPHRLGNNVIYLGTPIQQDFGAANNKAIGFFTFYSRSTSSKSESCDDFLYERLSLIEVPQRILIKIDYSDLDLDTKLELAYHQMTSPSVKSKPRIKIIITIKQVSTKLINRHPLIRKLKKLGVKIDLKIEVEEKPDHLEHDLDRNKISFISILHQLLDDAPELKEYYTTKFSH